MGPQLGHGRLITPRVFGYTPLPILAVRQAGGGV